jgi:DNA modification methylase
MLDLMYMDPPFFTKRDFGERAGEAGGAGFTDRWKGGLGEYLGWLEARVRGAHRLLSERGVFLLHLDWHAVHYAKVMCDQVFGEGRFQNELIWYYQTGGASKGRFSRKHDTILMYSKGEAFYFDGKAIAIPRTEKAMKRARCATGARIAVTDTHKNPDDVLVVPALNPMALERTGWPTQKPVELLEKLIVALCPAGGAVGDFCCGSGTTLAAAERLGRRWAGGDVSAEACEVARGRVGEVRRKLAADGHG